MIFVAYILLAIFFGIQLFSLISLVLHTPAKLEKRKDFPKVSILLAARNEEALIIRNLEAMELLNYPKESLEILIGNDASADSTSELVAEFIKDKPHFKLFQIDKTVGKGRGKANVLGQLAHQANGEFYFITDVDVKLPANWILGLLREFTAEVGLVSGTTKCERGSLFATLQGIDWLHFMGYIKAFANAGVGCTSVGNNMAVRAAAYWQTGGYENIDFSITEDYKLFKEVTSRGWQWRTTMREETLGLAWYIPDVKEMLHQRKRWLIGARELPLNWKFMLVLYGLFIPALLYVFYVDARLAMALWFGKFLLQSFFIIFLCIGVRRKPFSFFYLLVYELYVLANTAATALFYALPIKSVWKGREYNAAYLSFDTSAKKADTVSANRQAPDDKQVDTFSNTNSNTSSQSKTLN
jgi:cellulose synthase/poly-beta-1,6-N-acetylglucosamine synthase-like glycosyltransferase